jgi:hypothetical protein
MDELFYVVGPFRYNSEGPVILTSGPSSIRFFSSEVDAKAYAESRLRDSERAKGYSRAQLETIQWGRLQPKQRVKASFSLNKLLVALKELASEAIEPIKGTVNFDGETSITYKHPDGLLGGVDVDLDEHFELVDVEDDE